MPRLIEMWFDGCCEPKNPGGHAAWGAAVQVDGQMVWRKGGYCGVGNGMSNNVAEYAGFIAGIKEAMLLEGPILVRGDSRLVICQLDADAARQCGYRARWRANGGAYYELYLEAMVLYGQEKDRIKMRWVPREQNEICDVLSKQVLKDRGVVFRIQPEVP